MASELQFFGNPANQSGLTVIARVFNDSGAQVGSDVSCAETGVTAIYIGNMPAASAGDYGVRFYQAGLLIGQGEISWNGTVEVAHTDIGAIKAKTDSLNFTVGGKVDANVQYINEVEVVGVGSEADPWNPA